MDNLLNAASAVAKQVFGEYADRGGVVRDGERILSVDEASSCNGALPPVLWMLGEFITEYEIDFPKPIYAADPGAMLGVSITGIEVNRSASPLLFMLADFLRHELVPKTVHDFDMSLLFANFREWASQNVRLPEAPEPRLPAQNHEPE